MKKIFSLMLAVIMIVATFAAISIPTAAADGVWSVYTAKAQYLDGFADLPRTVPGYEYTKDGLQVTSPSTERSTPYVTVQTTNKVDLTQGFYMEVRVDDFTYAGDSWFSFHIWDQQNVQPGKQGEDYGYGVETNIRIKGGNKDDNNDNNWPGALASLQWYTDLAEGYRDLQGNDLAVSSSNQDKGIDDNCIYDDDFNNFDVNQKPIMTLEIKWLNPGISVTINGAPAPADFSQSVYDYFKANGNDMQAYVGFSMQNSVSGGVAQATVLKYGTSASSSATPVGDDHRDPVKPELAEVNIQDPDTIDEGQPAIIIDGTNEFDGKGKPSAYNGNKISVDVNGFVNITANNEAKATATFRVQDGVDYDAADFPIVLIITRNFCTCTYDVDENYEDIVECACGERISTKALAGDIVEANEYYNFLTKRNETGDDGKKYVKNYLDKDGNSYLSFITDWSDVDLLSKTSENSGAMSGRINGLRIDIDGVKIAEPGRNTLDICQIAFFRTEAEAEAYALQTIAEFCDMELPDEPEEDETEEDDEDETDAPEDTDIETSTETDTETSTETTPAETAPVETTPVETAPAETAPAETAPAETEPSDETDVPAEKETQPEKTPEKNESGNEQVNVNVGCSGTVGFGAIAIVALAGAGLLTFRKKED